MELLEGPLRQEKWGEATSYRKKEAALGATEHEPPHQLLGAPKSAAPQNQRWASPKMGMLAVQLLLAHDHCAWKFSGPGLAAN
jgi:hypothetical protein